MRDTCETGDALESRETLERHLLSSICNVYELDPKCKQTADIHAQVDYWCSQPPHLNLTTSEWLNLSAPLLDNGEFDKCHIFDIDYDLETSRPDDGTRVKKCISWDYDTTYYEVIDSPYYDGH